MGAGRPTRNFPEARDPPILQPVSSLRVVNARQHNLRDVNVEIPKRRLTVFTGVSGSGKSSLVFGTIAAESQRMINETYSAFVQGFMPTLARPEVDVLEGLTTATLLVNGWAPPMPSIWRGSGEPMTPSSTRSRSATSAGRSPARK